LEFSLPIVIFHAYDCTFIFLFCKEKPAFAGFSQRHIEPWR